MPSRALRDLALHSASQGINVSKCDIPHSDARQALLGEADAAAFKHRLVAKADHTELQVVLETHNAAPNRIYWLRRRWLRLSWTAAELSSNLGTSF
jgi:hypothetical protein